MNYELSPYALKALGEVPEILLMSLSSKEMVFKALLLPVHPYITRIACRTTAGADRPALAKKYFVRVRF